MTAANDVTAPPDDITPVPAPSLWRNRSLNLLLGSQTLSDLGTNMASLAVPLIVLAQTGSAVTAGVVGTTAGLARIAVRLPAGVLADRVDRKRTMIVCDVIRVIVFAGAAFALMMGHASLAVLIAMVMIDAVCGTVFSACEGGALPAFVRPDQMAQASARNEARMSAAGLIGPPLGGLLFSIARGLPLWGNAASYVVSMAGIGAIREPFQRGRRPEKASVFVDLREGWRFAVTEPVVRAALINAPLINLGFNGVLFAIILILRRHGVTPALIGTAETIISVAGLIGAFGAGLLLRRLSGRALIVSICWVGTALVAVSALLSGRLIMVVPIAVTFMLAPATNAALFGYQAAVTPNHLQGRVMSVIMFGAMSLAAIAPLTAGALVGAIGGIGTVLVFAGVLAVSATSVSFSKGIRMMGTAVPSSA